MVHHADAIHDLEIHRYPPLAMTTSILSAAHPHIGGRSAGQETALRAKTVESCGSLRVCPARGPFLPSAGLRGWISR